jgi:hypothetical protein
MFETNSNVLYKKILNVAQSLENNYKVTFENKSCVIKDQNNKKE